MTDPNPVQGCGDCARIRRATALELAAKAAELIAGMGGNRPGPSAAWQIQANLVRDAILQAAGCSCSPGARHGMPRVYAQDVLCPLHRTAEPPPGVLLVAAPLEAYQTLAADQARRWDYANVLGDDEVAGYIRQRAADDNLRADVDVVWRCAVAHFFPHRQADDPYRPTPLSYVSCGLPDGHPLWEEYAVVAVDRGAGWWSVKRLARAVTVGGEEVMPSREDSPDTRPELFMGLETALQVAARHARTFRWRGRTAADVLAADRQA